MSFIKDRIFVFDIETVIDIESSRNFLELSQSASKKEVLGKIKKYHIDITPALNSWNHAPHISLLLFQRNSLF